jgi:peroxiredoxin
MLNKYLSTSFKTLKLVYISFIILSLFFIVSCKNKNKTETTGVEISGTFSNAENLPLLLERLGATGFVYVDSIFTDEKGNFKATVKEPKTEFYRLRVNSRSFVVFILDSISNLKFTGDALNLNQTAVVTGNKNNESLMVVNRIASEIFLLNDSIMQVWKNRKEEENEVLLRNKLQEDFERGQEKINKKLIKFIDENLGNFAVISAVEYLDPDNYLNYYDKVYNSLKDKYHNSNYFKGFEARYNESKRVGVGALAPEIAMRNPLGETKKLSSFKGKYVLLDFWASWCAPCRAESANLVRLYNKYKNKGFEIFSVSLDNDAEKWKKAIMTDGLTWTHVSDLSNWESKVVPLYNLKSIPQTFLLDKEGRIIAKSLIGEKLNNKLKEIFGE